MGNSRSKQQTRLFIKKSAIIAILALLIFPMSAALAASGKGWVHTDSFRVLNFVVLVVGLFFILRSEQLYIYMYKVEHIPLFHQIIAKH